LSQTNRPASSKPIPYFRGVQLRKHGGEQLDGLVDIDDPVGLGEQRGRFDVGRQNLAVRSRMSRPRGGEAILSA